jgi:hypothetical protein
MKPVSVAKSRKASFFFGNFFFEAETALYVVLSIADLLITNHLLQHRAEGFQFVESNPVAREIIHHWGPRGMVYFKFGMVAVVVLITQIIARHRPFTARLVLFFAILMMIYVVVYSVRLFVAHLG